MNYEPIKYFTYQCYALSGLNIETADPYQNRRRQAWRLYIWLLFKFMGTADPLIPASVTPYQG